MGQRERKHMVLICPKGWFHDWMTTGEFFTHVMPKRGPFDPRDDEERQYAKVKYICSKCGEEKLKDLEYWC